MKIYQQAIEPKMKYVGSGLCIKDYDRYTEKYVVIGIIRKEEEEELGAYVSMKYKYNVVLLNLRTHNINEVTATSYAERTEPSGVTNIIDIEFE